MLDFGQQLFVGKRRPVDPAPTDFRLVSPGTDRSDPFAARRFGSVSRTDSGVVQNLTIPNTERLVLVLAARQEFSRRQLLQSDHKCPHYHPVADNDHVLVRTLPVQRLQDSIDPLTELSD